MHRLVLVVATVLLTACQTQPVSDPAPLPAAPPVDATRATVKVGTAPAVLAEVADTPQERAYGLMERTSVPDGTGMLFLYDRPSVEAFYMYKVPIPLTAVFAHEGKVVHVADMTPCAETDPIDCPLYGPDQVYDSVLETNATFLQGHVKVGDSFDASVPEIAPVPSPSR